MTTAEMKTLIPQLRHCQVMNGGFVQLPIVLSSEIVAAIETLLARQAEVLELLLTAPRPPMGPVHKAARILQDNPILFPENET